MILFTKLKCRVLALKENVSLLIIITLQLLLAGCHTYMLLRTNIQYHAELRIVGCLAIALFTFLFDRRGMAFGFVLYACSIIYINTFYNFGSIFFLLIAFGAYPKIRWPSVIIYAINVFISFSDKNLPPIATLIQLIYIGLFIIITIYVYKARTPKNLNLKTDERFILDQLMDGKLQKEIEEYSQQTITAKLKNARERNMCESTSDLIALYSLECGIKIGKCGKPCKKNCPKRETCCQD